MNSSKIISFSLAAMLGIGFSFSAVAQVRSPTPAPTPPATPKSGDNTEMLVVHPNGNGCPPTIAYSECFTEFPSLKSAVEACQSKLWRDGTAAYVKGRKQMCMHNIVKSASE